MISITSTDQKILAALAAVEIDNAHGAIWSLISRLMIRNNQWEAWLTGGICRCMPALASAWKRHLSTTHPGASLKVSTVFTHQSPYVKWKGGRCELADLLVAFVDNTSSPREGFAALIQAKLTDTTVLKLTSKSEKAQLTLLKRRPTFDIASSHGPKGIFLPTSVSGHDQALLYGGCPPKNLSLNPGPWGTDRWEVGGDLARSPGATTVSLTDDLSSLLVDLVQGNKGWKFECSPSGSTWRHFVGADDWSALINYLLETTFHSPLKSVRKAVGRGVRGEESMFITSNARPSWQIDLGQDGQEPLNWISTEGIDEIATEWERSQRDDGAIGFIPPDDGDEGDDAPENGPISAIVFEIGGVIETPLNK